MLSPSAIDQFVDKWRTSRLNVVREYLQNLFLSYLYQSPKSDTLGFKGGTALRLIFKSPRFSEDLDFTGGISVYHIKKLLSDTVARLASENIFCQVEESKPTTGGYLAVYAIELYGEKVGLELNISSRQRVKTEPILITTALIPHYQCLTLPVCDLVWEKIDALLRRKKARDFYDLYFLLRERLGLESIINKKADLTKAVKMLSAKALHLELKMFLPTTQHRLIANLPQELLDELRRL